MARYIDADAVIKEIDAAQVSLESNNDAMWEINKKYYKGLCMARRIIDEQPAADVAPKSEVDQLKKALEAQEAEYSQALHDKAREYNMVVDKICLEHRAEYARLHEAHQAELATAKREGAWEIFAELDKMDIRIVRLRDAIQYMDLVKKYEYDHKKKYKEGQT